MKKIFLTSSWSRKRFSGHSNDAEEYKLYETAWSELGVGNIQHGLWAKLYSENGGDAEKTKAAYLKERVRQLRTEQTGNDSIKSVLTEEESAQSDQASEETPTATSVSNRAIDSSSGFDHADRLKRIQECKDSKLTKPIPVSPAKQMAHKILLCDIGYSGNNSARYWNGDGKSFCTDSIQVGCGEIE